MSVMARPVAGLAPIHILVKALMVVVRVLSFGLVLRSALELATRIAAASGETDG